jgi:hypothetical protein
MKTSIIDLRSEYLTPSLRLIVFNLENAVCGSPLPGGNEDIGYDEW